MIKMQLFIFFIYTDIFFCDYTFIHALFVFEISYINSIL